MRKKVMTGVINRKGGVCKTTTTINLAALAANAGYKALLVDFDPQGSCTGNLDVAGTLEQRGANIEDYAASRIILERLNPSMLAVDSGFGFDIIPAGFELMSLEQYIPSVPNGDTLLSRIMLNDKELNYDFIIFDTPGFMGHIVASVVNVTGDIIIPNIATASSTAGLTDVLAMVREMNEFRAAYPGLGKVNIRGHFFCRAEPNTQAYRVENEKMTEMLGGIHLPDHFISKSTEIAKSELGKMPLVLMAPSHRVSTEYKSLFDRLFAE